MAQASFKVESIRVTSADEWLFAVSTRLFSVPCLFGLGFDGRSPHLRSRCAWVWVGALIWWVCVLLNI